MKLYVDINAAAEGNGSKERPFRHINDAARIAKAGDEVLVYPGVYREYVCPENAGLEDARITYTIIVFMRVILRFCGVLRPFLVKTADKATVFQRFLRLLPHQGKGALLWQTSAPSTAKRL